MLFSAGCATSEHGARPPRPGDGLREYQRLVLDLRQDVTLTRQALEALAAATQKNSAAAYAQFDDSLQRLEVVSIKARARADAMEKRGEAYFEEWAGEISGAMDEASRRAAQERFAELHRHFEVILKDTGQVRQEFRPFLEGVRRLRTTLGQAPRFEAIEQAKPSCAQTFNALGELALQLQSPRAANAAAELEAGLNIIAEAFAPVQQEMQAGTANRDTVVRMCRILDEAMLEWQKELNRCSSRLGTIR